MYFGGFHLWLCTLTMALVKEVCQKNPNSEKEWDRETEGCGEILRTELNLPHIHKYYPKFHVGLNLQRTREFLCGQLPIVVEGCSRSFLRFGCAGEFSAVCAHGLLCDCAIAGPSQW